MIAESTRARMRIRAPWRVGSHVCKGEQPSGLFGSAERAPWRVGSLFARGLRGEANHARRGALLLWGSCGVRTRKPPAHCSKLAIWTHRAAFARGNRPCCANSLRSGRTGRPSCTKTGRFRDAFRDRDANSGRKGPGGAPSEGGASRFPRSASPAGRKPAREGRSRAPICVPIVESVMESGLPRASDAPSRRCPQGPAAAGGRESGGRQPGAGSRPSRT